MRTHFATEMVQTRNFSERKVYPCKIVYDAKNL
jgi:hypothetical protein